MKSKKVFRLISLVAVMIGTIIMGLSAITAHATTGGTQPGNKVSITLNKLINNGNETITNTGNRVTVPSSMTPYNAAEYGNVTYTMYNIDKLMKDGDYTPESLVQAITQGKETPAEILTAQKEFTDAQKQNGNITQVAQNVISNTDGTTTMTNITNKGVYLILETAVDNTDHFTSISAPIIVSLPMKGTSSKLHLYPKNKVIPLTKDLKFTKVGQNPNQVNQDINLEGVKFQLTSSKTPTQIITSGANGKLDLQGIKINTEYTLKEIETINGYTLHPTGISVKFTVNKNGTISMIGEPKYFSLDGDKKGITIKNFLKTGGAKFEKVDAKNTETKLEGAKFKLSKVKDGVTSWAVFNGTTFASWTTNKDNATALVSGQYGTFSFTGVPYEADGAEGYSLIETEAPAGYVKSLDPIPVTINGSSSNTPAKQIKNKKYDLPITGGMGIWAFVLAGLALMGGSGYLYYKKQRA